VVTWVEVVIRMEVKDMVDTGMTVINHTVVVGIIVVVV